VICRSLIKISSVAFRIFRESMRLSQSIVHSHSWRSPHAFSRRSGESGPVIDGTLQTNRKDSEVVLWVSKCQDKSTEATSSA